MHWEVFVIVATSLFISIVGLPMALDKIPPNALYGFRTARTLADPKVWYEANREAGKALTVAGLVGAVGPVLAGLLVENGNRAMFISMAAMIVPLFVGIVYGFYKASAFTAELDHPGTSSRLIEDRGEESPEKDASGDTTSEAEKQLHTMKRAVRRRREGDS